MTPKVVSVVGARPNLMKLRTVHRAFLTPEADFALRVPRILAVREASGHVPPLWDGRSARRIVTVFREALTS